MDGWLNLVLTMQCLAETLFGWFQTLEDFTKKQGRYLKDGLERSIVNHHSIAQEDGDRKVVISLFSLLALGDKNNL